MSIVGQTGTWEQLNCHIKKVYLGQRRIRIIKIL